GCLFFCHAATTYAALEVGISGNISVSLDPLRIALLHEQSFRTTHIRLREKGTLAALRLYEKTGRNEIESVRLEARDHCPILRDNCFNFSDAHLLQDR